MTRKEAVDFLGKCRWWFEPFTSEKEQWNEALDIAIEALTQEPTQDLISRQAAIKNAHFPVIDDAGYEVVRVDDILGLPSAEPKTGEWYIREYEYFTCSECGEDYWNSCDSTAEAEELLETGDYPNYCPNCGARMTR